MGEKGHLPPYPRRRGVATRLEVLPRGRRSLPGLKLGNAGSPLVKFNVIIVALLWAIRLPLSLRVFCSSWGSYINIGDPRTPV